MATFPPFAPIQPAPKRSQARSSRLLMGDGYETAITFGLNPTEIEWSLTWLVTPTVATQIDDFLQARADAAEAFDWQPPDANTALRWRCDEWTVEQQNAVQHRLSATFRRAYENFNTIS